MKRNLAVGVLLLGVVGVAGFWLVSKPRRPGAGEATAVGSREVGREAAGAVSPLAARAAPGARTNAAAVVTSGSNGVSRPVTPRVLTADEIAAGKMRDWLDKDNESEALALARKLMKSDDASVRLEVVGVFAWVGVKGLPDLTMLLADKDQEVAKEALREWQVALQEISDEKMKAQMLVTGLSAMSDVDDLEETIMAFNELPDDVVVRNLVTLAQSENALAAKVAREHYEFVTGEPYKTPQTAEAWIKENVTDESQAATGAAANK